MVSGVFADKDEIIFESYAGKVTFTHKKHSETLKIDCLKCHHNWKQGETSGKLCRECHHKFWREGVRPLKDVLHHKACYGCHEEAKKVMIQQGRGESGCDLCHKK
jgi:hypothetical protein